MPPHNMHNQLAMEIMAKRTDYYAVLQVPKTADEREIRRSYHKLSLKLHPDKNPGNETTGAAYRVVNHCYEVLSDANKRGLYDAYGEDGLERFSRFGEDFPAFGEVLSFAVTYWSYLVVRRAALRSACGELVDEVFPGTAAAAASVAGASDANYLAQQEFAKAHAPDKRRARRQGRVWLVSLLALLCVLSAVDAFVFPILPSRSANRAQDVPVTPLGGAERVRRLQSETLFPSSTKGVSPVTMTLFGSCLALHDARDALCCQASKTDANNSAAACVNGTASRVVGGGGGDAVAAAGADNDFTVPVTRYGGSEADSITAFHALAWETCEQELLLAAASRDRYRDTSTLRRKGPLPAARSPNKAAKRKYVEKRWRPKFAESYTVAEPSELFHMSPFCTKLMQRSAEGRGGERE